MHAFRLEPGQDLLVEVRRYAEAHDLEAAAIATCVGSLERTVLRLADQAGPTAFEGRREIVSVVGTLGRSGAHVHMAVADASGATIGGHLVEGSRVYTTAEVVLIEATDLCFLREPCPLSGYRELVVGDRRSPGGAPP